MATYSKEELADIQAISLNMAKYFVSFCHEHGLLCYFCGGGAIGALRHGGFIPWDDDLDFFMPREDYNRLIELWPEFADKRYQLDVPSASQVTGDLFVNIRDTETVFMKDYQRDLNVTNGVALDILPLDGYPDGKYARKMQIVWAYIYSLFCAQRIPKNHGGLKAFGSKVLLGLIRSKKWRYKIWSFAERRMTRYPIAAHEHITELCSGPGYMKKKYCSTWFADKRMVPFEDTIMPIPVGAESYLTEAFGDFMTLPPVEKQVAHHDFQYLNLHPEAVSDALVSIIIPVYNIKDYLDQCMQSVLKQTYHNLEIILVDDGSTDSSGTMCDAYARFDERVRVFHKKNGGLSEARNLGLAHARGEYVMFVDGDDWVHRGMVERLMKGLVRTNADMACCQVQDVLEGDRPIEVTDGATETVYEGDEILQEWMAGTRINGNSPTKLIRRTAIGDSRFPVGKIYEDAFFVSILFPRLRRVYVTSAGLYYYRRGRMESISTASYTKKNLDVIEAYKRNLRFIMKNKPHLETAALHRLFWSYFMVLDKLVLTDTSVYEEDYRRIVRYMKRHRRAIMRNPYLSVKRKIQMSALIISPTLYTITVKVMLRRRGWLQ